MRFNKVLSLMLFAAITLFFAACTPEDDKPIESFKKGVLILNKGDANGSLSHYNPETQKVTNDLFEKNNGGQTIGKGLNALYFYNDSAYLTLTDANRTVVINKKDYSTRGNLEEIMQPRQFFPVTTLKAYVTSWGADGASGSVKVVDLQSRTVVREVVTGRGAESMVRIGSAVWVLNTGGKGLDSTISIVSIERDSVLRKIQLDGKAVEMRRDINGDVWVIIQKKSLNKSELLRISNENIEQRFDLPLDVKSFTINAKGTELYWISGKQIWRKDLLDFGRSTPSVFLSLSNLTSPQALGITTNDDIIYCADRREGTQRGQVFVFDVKTKTQKSSFEVGIDPIGFVFRD